MSNTQNIKVDDTVVQRGTKRRGQVAQIDEHGVLVDWESDPFNSHPRASISTWHLFRHVELFNPASASERAAKRHTGLVRDAINYRDERKS